MHAPCTPGCLSPPPQPSQPSHLNLPSHSSTVSRAAIPLDTLPRSRRHSHRRRRKASPTTLGFALFSAAVLLLFLTCAVRPAACELFGFRSALSKALGALKNALDSTLHACPYRQDIPLHFDELARERLVIHDDSVTSISDALQAWNRSRAEGVFNPLVLAFTGSTGVGKSETAYAVADGVLKDVVAPTSGHPSTPSGLLELRGNDYSDEHQEQLAVYQDQIKSRVVRHLQACSGRAVILFDEAGKAIPQVLDSLSSMMQHDHAHITHEIDGKLVTVDASHVIIIIVSDIGVPAIRDLMLRVGSDKHDLPEFQRILAQGLKTELDDHWKGLHIAPLVHKVVPFLPFRPEDVRNIVALNLQRLADKPSSMWQSLSFDTHLPSQLSTGHFIKYVRAEAPNANKPLLFAKYGARDIVVSHHGPLERLKAQLYKSLNEYRSTLPRSEAEVGPDGSGRKSSPVSGHGGPGNGAPGPTDDPTPPKPVKDSTAISVPHVFVAPAAGSDPKADIVICVSADPISSSDDPRCTLVWNGAI